MTYNSEAVAAAYDLLAGRWNEWASDVSPRLTPTYLAELIAEAGFEIISARVRDQLEPGDVAVRFPWVVARAV